VNASGRPSQVIFCVSSNSEALGSCFFWLYLHWRAKYVGIQPTCGLLLKITTHVVSYKLIMRLLIHVMSLTIG